MEEIEDSIGRKSIIDEDEESVTSNFTTIIFKPQHSIMLQKTKNKKNFLSSKQDQTKVTHKLDSKSFEQGITTNVQTENKVKLMDTLQLFNTTKV